MKKPLKYIAEPNHVREVSIVGTADLPYWKRWLEKEDLIPTESDGKAQLLIMASAMKYMGIKFQELSFSVLVSGHKEEARTDGMFLVHAFNSSRLFAYCERVLFSTPYYHGKVSVSATVPASIQLVHYGTLIFQAQMHTGTGVPARQSSGGGKAGWEGPIFLPGSRPGEDRMGKLFFARIQGHGRTYPFLQSNDTLAIASDNGILKALVDSHFVAKEWSIREDAKHARSKTYHRSNPLT